MQRRSIVCNTLLDLCNECNLTQFKNIKNIICFKILYLRVLPSFIAKIGMIGSPFATTCINTEMKWNWWAKNEQNEQKKTENMDSRSDLSMEYSKWTSEQWESCQLNPCRSLRLGLNNTDICNLFLDV